MTRRNVRKTKRGKEKKNKKQENKTDNMCWKLLQIVVDGQHRNLVEF